MTKEEIAFFRPKLAELQEKLKDLAGRYRMQKSGAYHEVVAIVVQLSDHVPSEQGPDTVKDA